MVKLLAIMEEGDVAKSDDVGPVLFGLMYLELLAGSHCKEDSECDKLGGYLFEF
jgi:hypothetical protein